MWDGVGTTHILRFGIRDVGWGGATHILRFGPQHGISDVGWDSRSYCLDHLFALSVYVVIVDFHT